MHLETFGLPQGSSLKGPSLTPAQAHIQPKQHCRSACCPTPSTAISCPLIPALALQRSSFRSFPECRSSQGLCHSQEPHHRPQLLKHSYSARQPGLSLISCSIWYPPRCTCFIYSTRATLLSLQNFSSCSAGGYLQHDSSSVISKHCPQT